MTSTAQRRWNKEEKESKYQSLFPPYEPIHHYRIYHVNKATTEEEIRYLLEVAHQTNDFVIDTESDFLSNIPALIQVLMLQSIQEQSPMVLFEMKFLPSSSSSLYALIKELFQCIFRFDCHLYCWGSLIRELESFQCYDLVPLVLDCYVHDVQLIFKVWFNRWLKSNQITDDTLDDCTDSVVIQAPDYDPALFIPASVMNDIKLSRNELWGLQDAIIYIFSQYLSKRDTLHKWTIGLDCRLFRNNQKNRLNHQRKLIQYACHDCLSVAQLMLFMYEYHLSSVNFESQNYEAMGEYFLFLDVTVSSNLGSIDSKQEFLFDEHSDVDEMTVHDQDERHEIASYVQQEFNQDSQGNDQQHLDIDYRYQQLDQQEVDHATVPSSRSKRKRSDLSRKRRNQKSSLRHRKNRYNYEIIRPVNMRTRDVKSILSRRAVPCKNVNIVNSTLYIGVKSRSFKDYYERLLSPNLFI
jgi:hypothetical protein